MIDIQSDLLPLLLNVDDTFVDVTEVVTNVDLVVLVVVGVTVVWRFSEKSIKFDSCFFFL